MTKDASKVRDSTLRLVQAKKGETTMQSPTLKQRHPAAIGLLLVGSLFLVAACGGSARPGSQPSRTTQAALITGGHSLLTPLATTTAIPTPTSARQQTSAPSATPMGAATPVPANLGTGSSNNLVPGVILAALALVALISLLSNRRIQRPPPDTE